MNDIITADERNVAPTPRIDAKPARNPNERTARRRSHATIVAATLSMWALTLAVMFLFGDPPEDASSIRFGLSISWIPALFVMMISMGATSGLIEPRTPPLPSRLDANIVRRMLEGLAAATTNGLSVVDRPTLQRQLNEASEALAILLGERPWVVTKRRHGGIAVPEHLAMRGDLLRQRGGELVAMMARSESTLGVRTEYLANATTPLVPTIAAIARDFGLDPAGFEAREIALPGRDAALVATVAQPAAAARRLADEWRAVGASRETACSMLADAAANELDVAVRLWERARSLAAPEDHLRLDADLGAAADAIAGTLSTAIAERARLASDDLATQRRFIEAKH